MTAVTTEKQDDIWIVTLDRPDVRNAVDSPTAHALHAAFLAFEDDATAKVAVFHGAHGHFCAGWDLQYGACLAAQGDSSGLDLDFPADDPRALGPMGPSRLQLTKP
ncbi:MAG: enoyl-CoA hydratase-related protein, partial [Hydrogenophaga sp.]